MESSVGNRDSYYGQGKPKTCIKVILGAERGIKKITGLEDEQNWWEIGSDVVQNF